MNHRKQRRPDYRKAQPRRMITPHRSVARISTCELMLLSVIASSPTSVESKPLGNGTYQHTFTWEVS